jgi:hypothetical protein
VRPSWVALSVDFGRAEQFCRIAGARNNRGSDRQPDGFEHESHCGGLGDLAEHAQAAAAGCATEYVHFEAPSGKARTAPRGIAITAQASSSGNRHGS